MKTLGFALLVLTICLLSSCTSFDWEPHSYSPDLETQSIQDSAEDIVYFTDERIEDFYCFPSENIAELAAAIENIDNKELRDKLILLLRQIK